jgi:hypothetical protein
MKPVAVTEIKDLRGVQKRKPVRLPVQSTNLREGPSPPRPRKGSSRICSEGDLPGKADSPVKKSVLLKVALLSLQ